MFSMVVAEFTVAEYSSTGTDNSREQLSQVTSSQSGEKKVAGLLA